MNYLDRDYVIFLNQLTLEKHGGLFIPPFNFLHEEQLDYILEAVGQEMFGEPLYPTVADKAAIYMFSIISNHVFSDGNKRTGLAAAIAFIRKNGHRLAPQLVDENSVPYLDTKHKNLEKFTFSVASGNYSIDQCRAWFAKNIRRVN